MESANDYPNRDPKSITLEGSNDAIITSFAGGNWSMIYQNTSIPIFNTRYEFQTLTFNNTTEYKHYRWTVNDIVGGGSGLAMQISEVRLLTSAVPEPSTYIAGLSALTMLGLFGYRNRK
jgi:hypothetical protein